jgi:uncharacterized metal-binding protein YceD (DUF177 family)
MPSFVLHIPDIEAGRTQYRFPLDAAWAGGALQGCDVRLAETITNTKALESATSDERANAAPDQVSIRAYKSGSDVIVQGAVDARLVGVCSRCLSDAQVALHAPFSVVFKSAGTGHRNERVRATGVHGANDEMEYDDDPLDHETYVGEQIVLDDYVRELLLVEFPIQPLCSESCTGIALPESVKNVHMSFGRPTEDLQTAQPSIALQSSTKENRS